MRGRPFAEAIRMSLARADIRLTAGEFLFLRGFVTLLAFVIGFLLGRGITQPLLGLFTGLVFVVSGWLAPHYYVLWRGRRRLQRFVNQLGDTIGLMANSLRAVYSLLQTMDLVARESAPRCPRSSGGSFARWASVFPSRTHSTICSNGYRARISISW